jgi:ABC-type transport system involved in multi-copper enzyme maturation permease subunit
MSGPTRYLQLQVERKTGFSTGLVIWMAVALLCAAVTFGLIILTVFVWLGDRYSPLTAALVLTGFFLLVTIIALVAAMILRSRTMEQARVALASRSQTTWLDPRYLGVAMQVGKSVGMKRLLPLVGVGLLAAGLAKEWAGRRNAADDYDSDAA